MLQKLTVRNFQKHRVLEVPFDKHVTCIVGPSDAGKSAVLRALRWVVCNRPSGTAFIHQGTDRVRVQLQLDSAVCVRDRGKKHNLYRLGTCVYRALGNLVPEAVATLLNIGPVSFASQHDAPFWFSDSPGTVAKNLNSVVNLDLIDKTLAQLASDLRKAKTTVEVSKQRLKNAREQRNSLCWVKETDVQLRKLEERETQIAQQRSRCSRIASLVAEAQKVVREAQEAATRLESLSRCVAAGEQMEAQRRKVEQLRQLLDECTEAETRVCQARTSATAASEEFNKLLRDKCPLCHQQLSKKL